ncbi:hypothetical protein KKJ09_13610 [Xenorhabdus bovienii]|uniref:hypothetical protein n=1 Tax=Xenorhabdus bovienii TaxID=40576 RepID=UPI0023B28394|nr:hypothetical protein [Xenorhabdus bovienii]MDE9494593.1 hypothetical protein [Xenorhabdus bovienii]MDE9502990.1 hypothetical protein [Xenorhabdus bovienii]MDE9526625.1 hypothetical protein [Xenorhabdus bovienii]
MKNNETQENTIFQSNYSIIDKVTILRLETNPTPSASNNVRVTCKDSFGKIQNNLFFAYPDKNIDGVCVYTTLLFCLSNNTTVTLKGGDYTNREGDKFITGVIIENPNNKNQTE